MDSMDDDIGGYDCPMPESFRDKIGMTLYLALLFYLCFVGRILFGPLMPEMQKDLGFSDIQSGYLFLTITCGQLAAALCAGMISSRINHSGALRLSVWLLGFALLLFLFVESIWTVSFVMAVIGFAGGVHMPSAVPTITAEIQKSDWGRGLAVHQLAPPLSFVSAPLIAATLLEWMTWREVLLVWGGLSLISALLYSYWGEGGDFPGRPLNFSNFKKLSKIPSFWMLVLLFSMAMAGNAGIFSMLPLFFVKERGFDLGTANLLLGLSQLSGLTMVFVAGMLADRFGLKLMMGAALGGAALLTLAIGVLEGVPLVVALFLQSAVLTAFFPTGYAAMARVSHPSLRSVTSAVGSSLAFLLGAGGVPLVIGHFATFSTFSAGIIAAGVYMLVGVPFVFLLKLGEYEGAPGC